jgi:hypothetical protein
MTKGDKVVYVFGHLLICEEVLSVRIKEGKEQIKLGNGIWQDKDERFHKVPREFKTGNYNNSENV